MGYTAAVLDDVEVEARELAAMVEASPRWEGSDVRTFFSPADLVASVAAGDVPDVLFVDICLGQANGVDLVSRLFSMGATSQVVYVSGHDEYHTRVYATDHASFLKKPFRQEDVDLALDQALSRLDDAGTAPLVLSHGHETEVVYPRDILYVESDRRQVIVHTRTGEHRSYGKLSDVLDRLPAHIVRCHQSYIVNLDFVERLGTESIALVTGQTIPVSRRWRASVREALFARIRGGR